MTEEFHELISNYVHQGQKPLIIAPQVAAPEQPLPPASSAQVHATDAVFAQAHDQGESLMAGLFGLWGGTMLLADLAQEHLRPPAADEEEPGEGDRDGK
jgi:hypothetical protein